MLDELQEDMCVFNQKITDGLAYTELRPAVKLVEQLIACAEKSFPPGFEFKQSTVCTPDEAYKVMASSMTRSDRSNASIDFAPSNVYLVKYEFLFDKVPLYPRYFWLPNPRRGGLMLITGKDFALTPVLIDPGFSVGEDHVFIRMNRAPVTFRRMYHSIVVDGDTSRPLSKHVAYSGLHWKAGSNNKKSSSDVISLGKVLSTLPHYLFCRYGLQDAFKRFAKCDVDIRHVDDLRDNPVDPDRYVVITSTHQLPSTLKVKLDRYRMIQSNMALIIPRAQWGDLTKTFATAFFYIVDHFPEVTDREELLGSWRWRMWMGHVLFGDQQGPVKLVENVESHLNTLDDYVDLDLRKTLIDEESLDVENIYELFAFILVEMDGMISSKQKNIGSMFGKRLVVAPYILRDIYEQIFRCLFEIINNRKRKHTVDDYNKILGKYFMPTTIFNLRKTSQKPFVSSVSTPGDNMFAKITSQLVMQAQTSGGRKGGNLNMNDPASHLHHSIAVSGMHLVLRKNCPLGRMVINPTANLDEKNTLLPKEHMVAMCEHIEDAIGRN